MANEKLTKSSLAKAMGISRPTLDKYLKEGFPKMESEQTILNARKIELGRRKIEVENRIRLYNYDLEKLNDELIYINKELENIEEEKEC